MADHSEYRVHTPLDQGFNDHMTYRPWRVCRSGRFDLYNPIRFADLEYFDCVVLSDTFSGLD